MSNTVHHSRSKSDRVVNGERFKAQDRRPLPRRTGTRAAVVAAARKEA